MGAIASEISREARYTLHDPVTAETAEALDTTRRPHAALGNLLEAWARAAPSPLVLLIDEIDAMVEDGIVHGLAHKELGNPRCTCIACLTRLPGDTR